MSDVLAYENAPLMETIVSALSKECREDEFVIYRRPFRWRRYRGDFENGHVLSGCYEMFGLDEVLEMKRLTARYRFGHAAIVKEAEHNN